MKPKIHLVLGALSGVVGGAGAGFAILGGSVWTLLIGLALHGAACGLSLKAARRRREGRLTPCERDSILVTAVTVPFLGPALAWSIPRHAEGEEVENAHQAVEKYLEHVKPRVPDYERTLFTGDHDRDLARKLDAESFREVLRYGETGQKRNALFRLAELGAPHHLAMIRECLTDDDQEVRLYAYGELDRLTRIHENAIAEGRAAVKEDPSDAEAKKALATAHLELASSGILDEHTGGFHFGVAARTAAEARELDPADPDAALIEGRAWARSGHLEKAMECLTSLPEESAELPEVCLTRAEVSFRRRDFAAARAEAGQIMLTGSELPGWLAALCMSPEPGEGEGLEGRDWSDIDAEGPAPAAAETGEVAREAGGTDDTPLTRAKSGAAGFSTGDLDELEMDTAELLERYAGLGGIVPDAVEVEEEDSAEIDDPEKTPDSVLDSGAAGFFESAIDDDVDTGEILRKYLSARPGAVDEPEAPDAPEARETPEAPADDLDDLSLSTNELREKYGRAEAEPPEPPAADDGLDELSLNMEELRRKYVVEDGAAAAAEEEEYDDPTPEPLPETSPDELLDDLSLNMEELRRKYGSEEPSAPEPEPPAGDAPDDLDDLMLDTEELRRKYLGDEPREEEDE